MERNSDDLAGTGNPGGTSGFAAGSAGGAVGSTGSSSNFSSDAGSTGDSGSLSGRARDAAGTAKDKLADVGSTVRDKAGSAKNSLADALESGADKLRQRGQGGRLAGATDTSEIAVSGDNRLGQVSDKVAGGMQATADWLRDADMNNLRSGVEQQVREHPGRTLLVAVGLGYLIGKAFRK